VLGGQTWRFASGSYPPVATGTSIPSHLRPACSEANWFACGSTSQAPRADLFGSNPNIRRSRMPTHVSGTVVARGDRWHGKWWGARALSGHPLLIPAALKAVCME